ncbi:unnamed protein product [Closterium sp. Naga37s-1]|nr:unnamed protein product [Closterium sp. Naga37s-1]
MSYPLSLYMEGGEAGKLEALRAGRGGASSLLSHSTHPFLAPSITSSPLLPFLIVPLCEGSIRPSHGFLRSLQLQYSDSGSESAPGWAAAAAEAAVVAAGRATCDLPVLFLSLPSTTQLASTNHVSQLASTNHVSQLASTNHVSQLASTNHVSQLASTNHVSQLASTNHVSQLASTNHVSQLASTNHVSQLASSNHVSQLASSNHVSQLASSNHVSQLASTNHVSQLASPMCHLASVQHAHTPPHTDPVPPACASAPVLHLSTRSCLLLSSNLSIPHLCAAGLSSAPLLSLLQPTSAPTLPTLRLLLLLLRQRDLAPDPGRHAPVTPLQTHTGMARGKVMGRRKGKEGGFGERGKERG